MQNDPFLRNKAWFMINFGPETNAEFMRAKFPGARLVPKGDIISGASA